MKMIRNLFIFLFLMSLSIISEAQKISDVIDYARKFNSIYPQEKVYLHFDNTGYFKGETIRFKAYVIRDDKEMLTDLSHVLYVELITSGGEIVETKKLPIIDGTAEGDISLEGILQSGFYEVRAYTRYMTNWGKDVCFSRVFPVFNKPKEKGNYSKKVMFDKSNRDMPYNQQEDNTVVPRKKLSITFYPEGGKLVKGICSKVAFQIHGMNREYPDENEMFIEDCSGNLIPTKISMSIDGRGVFSFTPDTTHFFFVVNNSDGKKIRFKLPEPEDEGCVMTVDAVNGSRIMMEISASEGMRDKNLGIVLMHHGNILYSNEIRISTKPYMLMFRREGMPAGVSTLAVISDSGTILSERLFFISPEPSSQNNIQIKPVTQNLAPCGKVQLDIRSLPDASFSLSVTDAASTVGEYNGNIKTWLLLSSELKGYIAHPEYYFEQDDMEHRMAADLLMMVQGWRKYDMKVIAGNDSIAITQPIEDKQYLYGCLSSTKKHDSVEDVEVSVYMYNNEGQVLKGSTVTNQNGRYAFELPDCNGEWNTIIRTRKGGKDMKYRVGIDRRFSPPLRCFHPLETMIKSGTTSNMSFSVYTDTVFAEGLSTIKNDGNKFILPTIKVKAKRVYDDAKSAWENENRGRWKAQLYYNCDRESDIIADKGEEVPDFLEWITTKNSSFAGNRNFHYEINGISTNEMKNINSRKKQMNDDVKAYRMTYNILDTIFLVNRDPITDMTILEVDAANLDAYMFNDGLTYKNRPVVWIVNNSYMMVSGLNGHPINVEGIAETTSAVTMPDFLDEVKSVYISEDKDIFMRYIQSSDLQVQNPVTVFVYTHHQFFEHAKGQRRTYFQGFNVPTTFHMEDYSVLPSADDFRRTIYWNPDVKTDKEGKAKVEFYNNSRCSRMYVSAEGFTKEGQFIANE